MPRPLYPLLGLLAGVALSASAAALPPIRGSFSGEAHVLGDAFPAIPWTLDVAPGPAGPGLRFILEARPPDARLRVMIEPASEGRDGAWRVEEAEADMDAWWPRLAPHLPADFESLAVGGRLVVTGEGPWTEDGPAGDLRFDWSSDTLSLPAQAVAIDQLRIEFAAAPGWREGKVNGRGRLRFARLTAGEITATGGEVVFAVDSSGDNVRLGIGPARFSAFGGEMAVASFTWRPGREKLVLRMRMTGAELSELAAFAPQAVREAQGKVSGEVVFRWTPAGGVVPLDGQLRVADGEPVTLRLAPKPGFLTRRVPRRLRLLPDWAGAIGRRWFSPVNPAYEVLEGVELGREPLLVEMLLIEFFAPDDPQGRTGRVRVEGRPQDQSLVENVTIEVNLAGPLAELLHLGLDERVSIENENGG